MASASTIVWRVTPAEHVRAVTDLQRYYARRERRLTRELRVVGIALVALTFIAWCVWRWRATGEFPVIIAVAAASGAALLVVYALSRPFALRVRARRQLTKNPLAMQQRRYTFDASGVQIAGDTFADTFPWGDIRHIGETPEFFLIFSQRSAYYLPKRAIAWPETLEGLREVMVEGIGARAKVR
jgi:hypothetical protein